MIWLTPREKQLLRRFAAGKTDAEIATHFGTRAKQFAEQRKRLLEKLGIKSEVEIAEIAKQLAPWPTYKGTT
jgi:DNA-binding CsgD family transcriptional regulator